MSKVALLFAILLLAGAASANLLVDGDMEAAGTASWTSYHATLSKDAAKPYSGLQDLMVAYLDDPQCYASQNVLQAGHRYHITGWANSDGILNPSVSGASYYIWTGNTSMDWQPIDVIPPTFKITTVIYFGAPACAATQYTQWDDLNIDEVPCVNLSNTSTWGTDVVNASGVLNINSNVTLCTDTYYLNNATSTAQVIQFGASNIYLDCNGSTIDGVDRNGYGIYETGKTNDIIRNCTFRNYGRGIYIEASDYNSLSNNVAYNNSEHGIYLYQSAWNNVTNNTAFNNTANGFLLNYLANWNILNNNTAHSNLQNGFLIQTTSENNTITGNVAYNNTLAGFRLNTANLNTFTNNNGYNNTGGYGFNIYPASYCTFTNNTASGDYYGFVCSTCTFNNFTNNTAYGNNPHGFVVQLTGTNNIFVGNTFRNNEQIGLYLAGTSANNILYNNSMFSNVQYGLLIQNSAGTNATNTHAYGNTLGEFYISTDATPRSVYLQNFTIDNPSGNFQNYTSINLSDSVDANTVYTIKYSQNTSALPSGRVSFAQKFINIAASAGTPIIDSISWTWLASETAGYTEGVFELWKYSTNWTLQNSTPDISAHTLSLSSMDPASVYGILQGTYAGCANLSNSGTWGTNIVNSSGVLYINRNTTLCTGTYSINTTASGNVLNINSSNIYLDCNNSVMNGVTGNGYGIYMTGKQNVTIRNCAVTMYKYGMDIASSSKNINITGNFLHNNTQRAIFIDGDANARANNFSLMHNNIWNGTQYGLYMEYTENSTFRNNTAYLNTLYAFYLESCQYDLFTGNNVSNQTSAANGDGFYITDSDYNNFTHNIFSGNAHYSLYCRSGSDYNIFDSNNQSSGTSFFYNNGGNYNNATNNVINCTPAACSGSTFYTSTTGTLFANNYIFNASSLAFQVYGTADQAINNSCDYCGYGITSIAPNSQIINNTFRKTTTAATTITASAAATGNNITGNLVNGSAQSCYSISGAGSNFSSNVAYNCTQDCFVMGVSGGYGAYDNLSGTICGRYGYSLSASYVWITNSMVSSASTYGFYLPSSGGYAYNNLTNVQADKSGYGFEFENHNYTVDNATASNSTTYGFYFGARDISIYNSTAYSSGSYNFYISNAKMNGTNIHLYNGTTADIYLTGSTVGRSVYFSNLTIDNQFGNYTNYTSISLYHAFTGPSIVYTIKWNGAPAALPAGVSKSFAQKYINITTSSGTPTINQTNFTWLDSELAGYNENNFRLYKYNASGWINQNATLDTTNNVLSLSNFIPGSTYGILQGIPDCVDLSDSTTWGTKVVNSSGVLYVNQNTTLCRGTYSINAGSGTPVLQINSSNIYLDCNQSILDGVDGDGYGIYMPAKENVTIRNCLAKGYAPGVYLSDSSYTTLLNNTAYDNTGNGFQAAGGRGMNFYNNTAYNNTQSGFRLDYSNYTSVLNNTARNNTLHGFYLLAGSMYNNITNSRAFGNAQYGVYITSGSDRAAVMGSEAYNNNRGFFVESTSNTLINNVTAYGNAQMGVRFESGDNNSVYNSTAYSNPTAFYFLGCDNATVANNTAYASGLSLLLVSINYSTIQQNVIYDNTYGLYLIYVNSSTVSNNTAYNNTQYGFYSENSTGNILASNTLYGNAYGAYIIGSNATNMTNTHLYNNSISDFYAATGTSTGSFYAGNLTLDNPYGTMENYTSLSITDMVEANTAYSIGWSANSSALPASVNASFAQKYVNITAVSGSPSIDAINFTWLESELPGYDENKFQLWKYNASGWANTGATLDTVNHLLSLGSFSPGSIYGILERSDTLPPNVTFEPPTPNSSTFSNVPAIEVNVSAADASGVANITIYLYNTSALFNYSNGTSGGLLATFSPLPDGIYYFNATAYDTVGNYNSTETRNVTIDTLPPNAGIEFPENGTAYNISSMDLNYTASDLYLDSCWYSLNGGADVPLPLCANATLSPGDGHYNLTLSANDSAGNANSTNVSFIVDTVAPSVAIQMPANSTYNYTGIDLNYTVSDSNRDSCWYVLNGGADVPLAGCTNTTLTAIEGQNSVFLYANDTAGNLNSTSVYFTVDTIAPSLAMQSPANATYNYTSLDLNYTASDIHIDSCWYSLNGGADVPLAGCANDTFTAIEGQNSLFLYANDTAGNLNSTSVYFTVDTIAPSLAMQSPANATYNYTGMDLNYTTFDIHPDSCWYVLNGGADVPLPGCANGTFTAIEGQNSVFLYANDTAGNLNSTNAYFTIDTIAPSVAIQSPSNSTYNFSAMDLNFTYYDLHPDSCWYVLNGGADMPLSGCTNSTIVAIEGQNSLRLHANDSAGNLNSTSVYFTVDTIAPSLAIQTPANTTYNYTSLGINFTASDTRLDSCWYVLNGGADVPLPGCANGTFTAIEGQNSVFLYANDTAGNTNHTNVSFTIDTIAPSVAIQSPANATYNFSAMDLNYTASDIHLGSCWYVLNGGADVPLPGCANATFTAIEGQNSAFLYANDTAGNLNSTNVSFTVDITAPSVAIQAPANTTYNYTSLGLNYTALDIHIDSCWYSLNGGEDVPLAGCTNTTLTAIEGQNSVFLYANDTAGNLNSTSVYFTVDTIAPSVAIQSPANATYNYTGMDLNYTTFDIHPDSCWYSLNGGADVPLPGCANATFAAIEGQNSLFLYANDSAGNTNSTGAYFTVDTTAPSIAIQIPANTTYNYTSLGINFTASDIHLDSCRYVLNAGANVPLPGCANATFTAIEGQNSVFLYANDTAGNLNSTNVYFTVDTIAPSLAIQSPANTTYNYTSMDLNYTASDLHRDSCWYVLNGGAPVALAGCMNTTFNAIEGQNSLSLYANDTAGNLNSTNVSFTVDSTSPSLAIQSPVAGTFYHHAPVALNYTASDTHLDSCWYELDGGSAVPLPGCLNSSISPPNGGHSLELFANDTSGNINSTSVSFTMQVPSSAPPAPADEDMEVEWEGVCPGNIITITASDGGPLEGVEVRLVLREPNAGQVGVEMTGEGGTASFNASMNGTYNAYLELSGYTYSNPLVFQYGTCPQEGLPETQECNESSDCAAGETCSGGVCITVEQPEEQPAEEEPEGGPSGQSTGGLPPGTEAPSAPECIANTECAPGFGCQNGSCTALSSSGQPAAQGEGEPGAGTPSTAAPAGIPSWAWLLLALVGAVAYWYLLLRKKA